MMKTCTIKSKDDDKDKYELFYEKSEQQRVQRNKSRNERYQELKMSTKLEDQEKYAEFLDKQRIRDQRRKEAKRVAREEKKQEAIDRILDGLKAAWNEYQK